VRPALIDDQLLSAVLRHKTPPALRRRQLYTTGYWFVRLCQAALGTPSQPGVLSTPFAALPAPLRDRAMTALMELPESIGLVSLRQLAPAISTLRQHHQLNILAIEALAAAKHLDADVFLSTNSPRLETSLAEEDIAVRVTSQSTRT
jgi:hypothetical protein